MVKTLSEFKPDLIITDYSMPEFDGMRALKLSLEHDPGIPVIILTGSINEVTAVACMKAGATDYVIKEFMSRLPFAVKEAMKAAVTRKEKETAIASLKESEQNYRTLANSGQALIWLSGTDKLCNYFNQIWLKFTGRTLEQELGNGWTEGVYPDDFQQCLDIYTQAFDNRKPFSMEYRLRRYDGEYRWIQDDGCPRYSINGEFIGYIGHCLDITVRKQAEAKLKTLLEEKTALVRELFHRTKNNMQVIMSMISMRISDTTDKEIATTYKEMINRIQAMAKIHEKLYHSQDLSRINLKEYLEEMVTNLLIGYSVPEGKISLKLEMEPIEVLIDSAIPCGQIANELLSNSIKYAFPGQKKGEIGVKLSRNSEGLIEMILSDNGIGIPEGTEKAKCGKLGLLLATGMAEYQLKGKVDFDTKHGVTCTVRFSDTWYSERV